MLRPPKKLEGVLPIPRSSFVVEHVRTQGNGTLARIVELTAGPATVGGTKR